MEITRRQRQSDLAVQIGGGAFVTGLIILLMVFLVSVAGCANVTVTQLADRCYVNGGKASVTFSGDTGRVDCQ